MEGVSCRESEGPRISQSGAAATDVRIGEDLEGNAKSPRRKDAKKRICSASFRSCSLFALFVAAFVVTFVGGCTDRLRLRRRLRQRGLRCRGRLNPYTAVEAVDTCGRA